MSNKFFRLLSVLLLSFQLLSDEFTFFNDYDAETDEGVAGLRLFSKNSKFIGLNCSPVNNFDGPVFWFSLGQNVGSSSERTSMFYKFDDNERVVFSAWPLEVDGTVYLTLVDTNKINYGTREFGWVEDFMHKLQSAETLTVGLIKSISETKFSNISGRENLEKFFEVASTIDSCYLRTAEEKARQIRVAAEAEAERKRQEAAAAAEKARQEAAAAAEKARQEAERKKREAAAAAKRAKEKAARYAEFRSDLTQIIKDHYLLFFAQPLQEIENTYYSPDREDGLCWGTELYEFMLNDAGNEYEYAVVIPSADFQLNTNDRYYYQYEYFERNYSTQGLWMLQMNASSPLEKFKSPMTLERIDYSRRDGDEFEESYHCADLSKIRNSYGFDDLKTEEYQNVRSIIGEEWSSYSPYNYDPVKVASLFNKLSFTLKIGGFKVNDQFEKLSNGFYQKWGESEFIEKMGGRSITDRTIWFKNKNGIKTPIVLKFSFDPYSYDVAGAIRFDEEDFDWSLWLD